jgi:5-formyltetrahydrofolate cyclo-ligase
VTDDEADETPAPRLASSPCLLDELDDPQQAIDVARWRRAERKRQLQARMALDAATRAERGHRIAAQLEALIGDVAGMTVSAYWPMRGEPDLRPLIERIAARGGRSALPVVVQRGRPLAFHGWAPGERLERGFWNIPVPAGGEPIEIPDVVIAPVVAYDNGCYRLGYGGGYFDRTLAQMRERPRVLGVGYAEAAVPTIFPQWHDVPMDAIVTELGVIGAPG